MGDKVEAKITAANAGLPLVPGSPGAVHNTAEAQLVGAEVGYPLLVKAASGGGGRGMKVAETADDLNDAFLPHARSKGGLGDDTVYLERYLGKPRHIEAQVIADRHACCASGERECRFNVAIKSYLKRPPPALNATTCSHWFHCSRGDAQNGLSWRWHNGISLRGWRIFLYRNEYPTSGRTSNY